MTTAVVEVRELYKTFSTGLIRTNPRLPGQAASWLERFAAKLPQGEKLHKMVEAVRGITFEVREGEIFGFLGPNGAGKTTTIKTLLGLIFPTRGEVRLFGRPVTAPATRRGMGFLPENPYLYQYLTAREIMDLCGRLVGLREPDRTRRAGEILERVGLAHAMDRPVRKFSKGMLQRVGLGQALIGDPDLLILDEPMTGLDPIGRKEVRDLILEERRRGRTVMFSSHILSDVELLCDRVAIVQQGTLAAYGSLDELLDRGVRAVEVELQGVTDALRQELAALPTTLSPLRDHTLVTVHGEAGVAAVLAAALRHGARVAAVTPRRETLEDLFMRKAIAAPAAPVAPGGPEG